MGSSNFDRFVSSAGLDRGGLTEASPAMPRLPTDPIVAGVWLVGSVR